MRNSSPSPYLPFGIDSIFIGFGEGRVLEEYVSESKMKRGHENHRRTRIRKRSAGISGGSVTLHLGKGALIGAFSCAFVRVYVKPTVEEEPSTKRTRTITTRAKKIGKEGPGMLASDRMTNL